MIRSLDLLMTYECPAECRHCAYFSGPRKGPRMSIEKAREYLSLTGLSSLTVHGGEPTIHFESLCEIFQLAMERGLSETWLITNGFWGDRVAKARRMLECLRESGLNNISFSVDSMHQEHVRFTSVMRCVKEASSIGFRRVCVDACYLVGPDSDNPYDIRTASLVDRISHLDVEVNERRLTFYGRGSSLGMQVDRKYLPDGGCTPPFWVGESLKEPDAIEIDPFGNVTLCPGLRIGNAEEGDLETILLEYNESGNPVVNLLVDEGPIGLVGLAEMLRLEHEDHFVDECHMCYEMRRLLQPLFSVYLGPSRCYGP